jgi:hypothetical protein
MLRKRFTTKPTSSSEPLRSFGQPQWLAIMLHTLIAARRTPSIARDLPSVRVNL